jgi:hypothetical protein
VLNEVALEGHGGIPKHLQVFPEAEGERARDKLELTDFNAI